MVAFWSIMGVRLGMYPLAHHTTRVLQESLRLILIGEKTSLTRPLKPKSSSLISKRPVWVALWLWHHMSTLVSERQFKANVNCEPFENHAMEGNIGIH